MNRERADGHRGMRMTAGDGFQAGPPRPAAGAQKGISGPAAAKADTEYRGRTLLRGSLSAFSPWEILQWFAYREGEGTLVLSRAADGAREQAWLHIEEGCIRALEIESVRVDDRAPARNAAEAKPGRTDGTRLEVGSGPEESCEPAASRLGGRLIDGGYVRVPQLRFALALQRLMAAEGKGWRWLGQLLHDCGHLPAPQLDRALQDLARERLMMVLGWRTGTFRFSAAVPSRPGLPVGQRIEPLLLQLSHRIDDRAGETEPPSAPSGRPV
ncbi:MAG: DUF4388 domain-containing protein [Candidatus Eisenbacteria bacterium]